MVFSKEFERSRAFLFLNDIKKRFQTSFGMHVHTALPYAMNTEFSKVLAAQMVSHFRVHHLLSLQANHCPDSTEFHKPRLIQKFKSQSETLFRST